MKHNRVERLMDRLNGAGKNIQRSRSLSLSPQITRASFRRSASDVYNGTPEVARHQPSTGTPILTRSSPLPSASSYSPKPVVQPPKPVVEPPKHSEDPLEVVTEALEKLEVQDKLKFAPKPSIFEKIMNFRDLADSDFRIKKGILYRSGLIHMASEKDLITLAGDFHIKTLIDLRSTDEIKQHPSPILDRYFSPQDTSVIYSPYRASRMRVNCPLWKATINFKILIEGKKYRNIASSMFSFMIGERQQGIQTLLGEMNEIKLPGMYQCFIRYAQREIKLAFDILADSRNYPVLVHCSLGKDRTGVIMALVSETLGVDRKIICEEYSKSQRNLSPIREEIKLELGKYHFGDWLLDSPYEVMDGFLRYIDQMFGNTSNFLSSIGVHLHQQQTIKLLLSP